MQAVTGEAEMPLSDRDVARVVFPRRGRGRQGVAAEALYREQRSAFCDHLLEIRSRLDFEIGARGWGYILENEGVITKDELDACERLITECRKSGELPLDICASDESRAAENLEQLDENDPTEKAQVILDWIAQAHRFYTPLSFWEFQSCYVEILVEKIDLKSLFSPTCAEFNVPIANTKGWSDLNSRAAMMRRFGEWEGRGKRPVLLYCGDHDPAGLNISAFLRSNLAELADATGWSPDNLIISRFGLNADFIERHGFPWIENLITSSGGRLDDPKHPDHGKDYVQR